MKLVEVDVVRLQSIKASLHCLPDGIRMKPAGPDKARKGRRSGDLRGQHNLFTLAGLPEPAPDDLLGQGIPVFMGRDGVQFSCIEKIDPLAQGIVHLGMSFGLRILAAPCHGPKANLTYPYVGLREERVLHTSGLSVTGRISRVLVI